MGLLIGLQAVAHQDLALEPIQAPLVLLAPVGLYALLTLARRPVGQRLPVPLIVVQGHRHATGGLHPLDVEQEDLPGRHAGRKERHGRLPARVAAVQHPRLAIDPQYHRRPLEGAEHHRHARVLQHMGRRLVTAAGQIEPGQGMGIENAQRIPALGGEVDRALRRRADKIDLLRSDKGHMARRERLEQLSHSPFPCNLHGAQNRALLSHRCAPMLTI